MKHLRCHCGQTVYFENSLCLRCGHALGFLPDRRRMGTFAIDDDGEWQLLGSDGGTRYRPCHNYSVEQVCNWMCDASETDIYCVSCRLTKIIPDLSIEGNRVLWLRLEAAKRRMIYTLLSLRLPIRFDNHPNQPKLTFAFMGGLEAGENNDSMSPPVITGHNEGLITINIAEADPSHREKVREMMKEKYRTLLGHFRHEVGHFYWLALVDSSPWQQQFRDLFGDERVNYSAMLNSYYDNGPPAGWEQFYITAYASSHPWEDFAETWAHYLHMLDTLETGHRFGFAIEGRVMTEPHAAIFPAQAAQMGLDDRDNIIQAATFDDLLEDWLSLTLVLNSLNRSMGLEDAMPFCISNQAARKLEFVHRLIASTR